MAESKSVKKPSVPEVPALPTLLQPSEASVPYEPMSMEVYHDWVQQFVRSQLAWQPRITKAQVANQQALMQGAFEEQMRQVPILAQQQYGLDTQYMPAYTALYNQQLAAANPQFMPTYNALGEQVRAGLNLAGDPVGQNVMADLAAGRDLGPGLSHEIEQAIRGAQSARGNIMGAAPTAQEAFGKGMAAENLYTQRLGRADALRLEREQQAQAFLQGRQPTDMWGAIQSARLSPTPNAAMYPSQSYVQNATSIAGQQMQSTSQYNTASVAAQSVTAQAQSSYNNALLTGYQAQGQFGYETYDRSLNQYYYDQSVQHGLYSNPAAGGGGGMGMGGMGMAIGGVAGGLATAGLAAAGTATGVATGVGAAISAAGAAICWIARRCMGKDWKLWRHYLLTKASPQLRNWYIFNGRRAAKAISQDIASRIGSTMRKIATA